MAVACEPQQQRIIPLHQRLWSAAAPDFGSENAQLLQVVDTIKGAIGGRGIYVMDRGGDRGKLINPLLQRKLRFIVGGYLSRRLVEETIRFIKQSYRLEDIRVLDYERLRNLVALVPAAAYFSAVWLGESLKLRILRRRVARLARRFFGVPDFHYYAVTDGIAVVLTRFGKWMHEMWTVKSQTNPAQGALFTLP